MLERGQSVYRNRRDGGRTNAAERRGTPSGRSTRTRTSPQPQRDFPAVFSRNPGQIVASGSRDRRSRARCSRAGCSGHGDSQGCFRRTSNRTGRFCQRSSADANRVGHNRRAAGPVPGVGFL
jgi:hypothetical protein